MCIAVLARSGWHALGQRVGSLYFFVNKAYSQGSVTLRSADPARSRWSISACCRTGAISNGCAPHSASWRRSRPRPSSTAFVKGLSDQLLRSRPPRIAPGLRNAIQMRRSQHARRGAAAARWLIDTLMTGGVTLADLLADDATLDAYLNKAVAGVWHPVGTCRMGRDAIRWR